MEIDFNNGGLIEEGGYRYTCENTGGCAVRNREVQTGTIVETSTATTPTHADAHSNAAAPSAAGTDAHSNSAAAADANTDSADS